jgi:NAD(P)-dependent dehydrogenase (short-subunit alcohol dehydrogenase family)
MDLHLAGRSVLITGGSQGIGLAAARAFAVEGCNLHLAARTESRLQEAKREIVGVDLVTADEGGSVQSQMIHRIQYVFGRTLRQQADEQLGDPERWRERLANQPSGRAATEEDIANAVVFLASSRAGFISGEVLAVDGGLRWRQRVL